MSNKEKVMKPKKPKWEIIYDEWYEGAENEA